MGRFSKLLDPARNAEAHLEVAVTQHVRKYVERVAQAEQTAERVFMDRHVDLDGQLGDLHDFHKELEDFAKNDKAGSGSGGDGNAYKGTDGKS